MPKSLEIELLLPEAPELLKGIFLVVRIRFLPSQMVGSYPVGKKIFLYISASSCRQARPAIVAIAPRNGTVAKRQSVL